jgi:hypothetical protein
MNNTNVQPLNCIKIMVNNRTDNAPKVTIKSTKKATGGWECIGYVNDNPVCTCWSKDKAYNEAAVKEDLADMGYVYSIKRQAPVMSMKGSFAEVIERLNPETPPTDAFLSETNTDLRTEYAA